MLKRNYKPITVAIGSVFVASLGLSTPAAADVSPFVADALGSGYLLAADDAQGNGDKADGEGKCGEEKAEGEGKCGAGKEEKSEGEGKCGEGKCGGAA